MEATIVLKKAQSDFGKENYKISEEDRDLIEAIIYSGNHRSNRFKLNKENKFSKSDYKLFKIRDDQSLRFVINMMNFVVDDANREASIPFINEWVGIGCPLTPNEFDEIMMKRKNGQPKYPS